MPSVQQDWTNDNENPYIVEQLAYHTQHETDLAEERIHQQNIISIENCLKLLIFP